MWMERARKRWNILWIIHKTIILTSFWMIDSCVMLLKIYFSIRANLSEWFDEQFLPEEKLFYFPHLLQFICCNSLTHSLKSFIILLLVGIDIHKCSPNLDEYAMISDKVICCRVSYKQYQVFQQLAQLASAWWVWVWVGKKDFLLRELCYVDIKA
jgi:hypothetical protein